MKQSIFNHLSLENKIEIYNQWLYDSKLEQYELYENDNDGLETLLERNFYVLPTTDIIDILVHSTYYDIYDKVVTFDYDYGFRSLTDDDVQERFDNQDFLGFLDGVKGSDYNVG